MSILKFLAQFIYFIIVSVPICLCVLLFIELKSTGSAFVVWFIRFVNKGSAFLCTAFFMLTNSIKRTL